jgi:diadenosine tetraphosphate (Ap4A) HIT family hydrolase
LTDDEVCAYESEVLTVARALRRHFQPAQVNYLTLGNQIPHLHTNVVLRYVDDPAPAGTVDLSGSKPIADDELEEQAATLRAILRRPIEGSIPPGEPYS